MSETNGNGTHPRLSLPRLRVTLADREEPVVVQVLNVDLLKWDRTAAKHGWPDFQAARTWHATFCAWSALKRSGVIEDSVTWEAFSDELCVEVTAVPGEDGEPEAERFADPTRSGPAPD